MDNKSYFKFSQDNDDGIVNFSKAEGVLVVNRSSSEPATELMISNHKLIELITTYKTLKEDPDFNGESINRIVDQVIHIIETTDLINYSAFCVYFQVVGYSYSSFCCDKNTLELRDKRELMKRLLDSYIDYRHNMYTFHGYSDQILQVNSDAASSRRKGKTGIEKMIDILKPLGFVKGISILDMKYKKYCYILPDKGDASLFDRFLQENHIKYEFRKTRENKNPDLLIKFNNHYYILEHKLTNGGGGSQNAEINEIIQFINYEEENNHWHYISCLQGNYFKKLNVNNSEPKASSQYSNIITNLNTHKGNYFVNGKGMEKLIHDLYNSESILDLVENVNKVCLK